MEDRGFVTMPIEDQLEDMTRSTSKRAEIANFPTKLHFMLSEMERDGLDHIAGWQPHGRAFTVKNTKEFETKILPCYFQQTKYTSFQRQLSFYGFRRITSGPDKNGYYHELCVRGHSKLTYDIPRLAKKSVERKSKNAALSKSAVLRFNQMPLPPARSEISRGLTAEELPYDRAQDPQLERSSAGICQPAPIVQNQPSCQSYSIEAQRPNQCHSHFPMSAVPSPHHRVSFGLGMQPTVQDLFSLDQLRPRPDSGTLPYTMSVRDRLLRAQILMLIGNRSC